MTIRIPGYTTLSGRPAAILRVMQDARMFDSAGTPDEYIAKIIQAAWSFYGIALNVTGGTIAARAESLLREMSRHGMIEITDND